MADRPPAHMRLPAAKRLPPHTCVLLTGAGGASQESEAWRGRGHVPGMRAGLPHLQRPDPWGSRARGRPCLCPHRPRGGRRPRARGFPLPGSERRPGKQSVLSPNHDVVPKEIRLSTHDRAPHDPQPPSAALCFPPPAFPDNSASPTTFHAPAEDPAPPGLLTAPPRRTRDLQPRRVPHLSNPPSSLRSPGGHLTPGCPLRRLPSHQLAPERPFHTPPSHSHQRPPQAPRLSGSSVALEALPAAAPRAGPVPHHLQPSS